MARKYVKKDSYYEKKLNELKGYEAEFAPKSKTFQKMKLGTFKQVYEESLKEAKNATELMKDLKWGMTHDVSRKTFREMSKFLNAQEKEQRATTEWGKKKDIKHYSKNDLANMTEGGTREFIKAHRTELKALWRASEMYEKLKESEFYSLYLFGSA